MVGKNSEDTKRMYKLYLSGKTLAEVGEIYGITREAVRQRFASLGLGTRSRGHITPKSLAARAMRRKELPADALQRLYTKERKNLQQVAAELGVSIAKVSSEIHRHKIHMRSGQDRYRRPDLTPELLKKLYLVDGLKAQEIGDMYGYSRVTIAVKLRKINVRKIKPPRKRRF
jgi:Sigma-70, region 4